MDSYRWEAELPRVPFKRRNAIGKAFAVPVLTRLLVALSLCLTTPVEGTFPQWFPGSLAIPHRHDVLDDILLDARFTAARYSDLTSEFVNFHRNPTTMA